MTAKEAAHTLHLPPIRFRWYAGRLHLGRPISAKYRAPRDYSEADLNKLRSLMAGLVDIHETARILELSKTQVRLYAKKLGIKQRPPFQHFWFTVHEVEAIREAHESGHARQQRGNRARQHAALLRESRDYYGHVCAFAIENTIVDDPELSSTMEGPQTPTLQWRPFYVSEELADDDNDTSKWGNINEARKWISFEELGTFG